MIRVLLTESQISAETTNFKGRNPLHILANFAQDNAVAIFDLFFECMPDYPLDKTDGDGNTGTVHEITKNITLINSRIYKMFRNENPRDLLRLCD